MNIKITPSDYEILFFTIAMIKIFAFLGLETFISTSCDFYKKS